MNQPTTSTPSPTTLFDGTTDPTDIEIDLRLGRQLQRVYAAMSDGRWRSLARISGIARAPQASVSARLRDLRKPRFGGFTIDHRHIEDGLYEYRLVPGSGDPELVRNPQSEPRSAKAEARAAIRDYLDVYYGRHLTVHPQRAVVTIFDQFGRVHGFTFQQLEEMLR